MLFVCVSLLNKKIKTKKKWSCGNFAVRPCRLVFEAEKRPKISSNLRNLTNDRIGVFTVTTFSLIASAQLLLHKKEKNRIWRRIKYSICTEEKILCQKVPSRWHRSRTTMAIASPFKPSSAIVNNRKLVDRVSSDHLLLLGASSSLRDVSHSTFSMTSGVSRRSVMRCTCISDKKL